MTFFRTGVIVMWCPTSYRGNFARYVEGGAALEVLSGSEIDITTVAFLVLLLESVRVSQGRGVNGMDRQINFYLGHAECNNENDETYGKEQDIQISWNKK